MDADRHLLYGLLGLQTGLIDQAQLVAAFQAWTRDKARSLADHLEARGDLTAAKRALLEGLAQVHLEDHGGDAEKSLGFIPVSGACRSSLADLGEPQLEATLARVGLGRPRGGQTTRVGDEDPDATTGFSLGAATSDGQRFRLLRPHARGGLGAVFVATDTELKREVAVKQILEQHADDDTSRQRFVAEAEITGGLEHPGVVPVYGLGTHPDGRPFYAMRFIRGESLKEAIEAFHRGGTAGDRPLELRKLLRRFLDVCNAIDYAHSRGVIHRDVKPANIILGRYGETLVVDWGLAKAVGRADPTVGEQTIAPSSGGSSETLPGSALGTPAYMSPEQAAGSLDRLGPRSDVYSLGATLYCLLTGRPPFEGPDLGAILQRVGQGTFATPRQVDPSIERPLEAICLRAMAVEPDDRYATAKALADDLEQWMADEPVAAYREPLSRRLRRWSRRNRTAVTAAAVALLALLASLGAVTTVQARANRELRALNGRLEAANAALFDEKARVQQRFDLAMEAIRTFHTGVSEDFLLKEDRFRSLRERLLKSAADFYGRLGGLLKQRTDRESRRALAGAEFELAELTAKVGDAKQALQRHREVLALREALSDEPGADDEIRAEVGRSLIALGQSQLAMGQTAEAQASYLAAQSRLATLVAAGTDRLVFRSDLATAEDALGNLLHLAARPAEALRRLERAREVREALATIEPANTMYQADLATTSSRIALMLRDMGRPEEALNWFKSALAIQQRLVSLEPGVTAFRYELARSQSDVGLLLEGAGHSDAALESYSLARDHYQRLVQTNPAVSSFQEGLADSHRSIAGLLLLAGRPSESLEPYLRTVAIRRQLTEANPEVLNYNLRLAQALMGLSEAQAQLGQLDAALETARQGITIGRKLVASNPEIMRTHFVLAYSLAAAGRVEDRLGRREEAANRLREAIASWEAIPEDARIPTARYNLACHRALLVGVLAGLGPGHEAEVEGDRAMKALRSAITHGYRSLTDLRNDPDLDALRNRTDFQALLLDLAFPERPFAP